jgi:hypothetical protein
MYRTINVRVPEPNPEETDRVFKEVFGREDWSIFQDTVPPDLPSSPPPTQRSESDEEPEERPQPFPVAEIDLSEAQERMGVQQEIGCPVHGMSYLDDCPACIDYWQD